MGKNLDKGKKYFKPQGEYTYPNLDDVANKYKSDLEFDRAKAHGQPQTARCPGINHYKRVGYVLLNHKEIRGPDVALPIANRPNTPLVDTFPNFPNATDYVIHKYDSKWRAVVPKGYQLLSIPTSYHTNEWASLPGFINPEHSLLHKGIRACLNAFLIIKKDQIIPIGSPIAQFMILQTAIPEVSVELHTSDDLVIEMHSQLLGKLQFEDKQKFKQAKRSHLFKSDELED